MLGEILGSDLVQKTSAEDASAMIPHKAKGWGQQESKPHSVQRPEGRRTAYLCRCDYPWHRPELSCRLAAHEPDARGGCGLPPVLSTLAHGDFPRSMCCRSELLVCQLRSRASRAPRAPDVWDADMIGQTSRLAQLDLAQFTCEPRKTPKKSEKTLGSQSVLPCHV